MPPPTPLPDPQWTEGPQECIGCGYSLEGLAIPGKCPECGVPFDSQVMVLHGVPRSSSGTPLWRRLVWIATAVFLFVLVQFWPLLLMVSWVILVVGFVACLGAMAFMLATGKRERAGTERFMFTSAGLARLPAKRGDRGAAMDSVFIPFSALGKFRVQTISPVWRRIRVYMPTSHTAEQLVFDAGFRCPSEHVDRVIATIEAAIRGEAMLALLPNASHSDITPPPLPAHPPITPPPISRHTR